MRAPNSRTFFDMIEEQAARYPEAVAVIVEDRFVSYGALALRARRVAAALRARGIGRGDRVGILINNRIEWLDVFFGAAALGAVVVPFSTWSTRSEIDFLLEDSQVALLVSLNQFGDQDFAAHLAALAPELTQNVSEGARAARYPHLRGIVFVGEGHVSRAQSFEAFTDVAPLTDDLAPGDGVSAGDDAVILYTSGSSKKPKAVRLLHFGAIETGFNIGERQGLRPGDRVLLSPPLFWSYGCINAMPATLGHGAALVLQGRFEPGEALDLIEKHRCTALYTLPGITSALIRHPEFKPERTRSLRTGLTIGSPNDVITAAQVLGAREICNIYGSTETYGNTCVAWHHWSLERRAHCQGPPLPGMNVRIVDIETGAPLGVGEDGLVEVAGYITPGYCGASSENNALLFTADGYFKTGDIGRFNENGDFVFAGRNTEMIKRAGINVSPAEVEEVLLQHEKVSQAGVVGVADPERGELIYAFVIPAPGATPTEDELRTHCGAHLSKYKLPDRITIRPALPMTVTGKLMRRELKQEAAAAHARGAEAT